MNRKLKEGEMEKRVGKISIGMAVIALILAGFGSAVSIAMYYIMANFKQSLDSFGPDLPMLTDIILNGGNKYIWIAGACILLASINVVIRSKPAFIVSFVFSSCLLLMIPIAIVAMYLPIFTLGEA